MVVPVRLNCVGLDWNEEEWPKLLELVTAVIKFLNI